MRKVSGWHDRSLIFYKAVMNGGGHNRWHGEHRPAGSVQQPVKQDDRVFGGSLRAGVDQPLA
jgi:hypothetical protein